MTERPVSSIAFARASTSKADSVPSLPMPAAIVLVAIIALLRTQ